MSDDAQHCTLVALTAQIFLLRKQVLWKRNDPVRVKQDVDE